MSEEGSLRFRLSAMMFLQYISLGAWAVTLATFLLSSPLKGGLAFSPQQVSWIYSTLAIGGILTPLLVGLLADRLFAAEKLLGVLHLIGTGQLVGIAWWCEERLPKIQEVYCKIAEQESVLGVSYLQAVGKTPVDPQIQESLRQAAERIRERPELQSVIAETFQPLFVGMLLYCLGYLITITLTNVICMRHLPRASENFGRVRMYGTVAWIVVGIIVEVLLNPISVQPFWFAAAASLLMAWFSFWALPHTPPSGHGRSIRDALGLSAFGMFRERSFCILVGCSLALSVLQQFYSVYANKFLNDLGALRPAAIQTLAQVGEVACMALFSWAMVRLGMRTMMLIGMIAWILRNALFATLSLPWVVAVALPLHGLAYTFYFLVLTVYIDRKAPPHLRASSQGITTFLTMGAGTLVGNALSAYVVRWQTIGEQVQWANVWMIPTLGALVVLALFAWFFRCETESVVAGAIENRESSESPRTPCLIVERALVIAEKDAAPRTAIMPSQTKLVNRLEWQPTTRSVPATG